MSKKDQPSKYLASFYTNPAAAASGNAPKNVPANNATKSEGTVQQTIPTGNSGVRGGQFVPKFGTMPSTSKQFPGSQMTQNRVNLPAQDAGKFKNPADFFKSSQSMSSQITPSQNKPLAVKRTSFGGGGSSHEMLSQSFQVKKPQMLGGNMSTTAKTTSGQSMGAQNTGPKSSFGYNSKYPVTQRKSHIVMDKDVASTNALQLQWTQKMCQKKDNRAGNLDKRNLARNEMKSPLGKSFWADSSFSKTKETCKNQQNDPWYSNDVWGDDLPEEAVDACLLMASQGAQKPSTNNDPLSSWMDESWASPQKTAPASQSASGSVRTSLFSGKTAHPHQGTKSESFLSLLSGDDDFLALIDNVEAQTKPNTSSKSASSFSLSGKVSFPVPSAPRPMMPQSSQARRIVPFSERMPVGSGDKSSFVIKAKEFESPNKQETLSHSQRTFRKPVKSLPSPTTTKMSFTTEWLRGQLEKISSENTTLKEDVQLKEGESKLLREKLKTAEEEAQKHKLDKCKELEKLREGYEAKVKLLEKQLEATQTQAMFKAREAESSLEKYRELKSISVRTPEPAKCQSFKNIPSIGPKPGETTKAEVLADEITRAEVLADETARAEVLADETVSLEESAKILEPTVSADFINDTINVFETPPKVVEPSIECSPEKMFESPVKPIEETSLPPTLPAPLPPTLPAPLPPTLPAPMTATPYVLPKQLVFNRDFIQRNAIFKKVAAQVVHGKQPKRELNHFLMPPMEYLPHTLLKTEFSEHEVENYLVRRPTLIELWGVPYNAFGDAVLDDYEKAAVGDAIPPDPAKTILSKSRYFSTLQPVHGCLVFLADSVRWGPPEWEMAKSVVDLATSMVKELYATLGDPRHLRATYTIYDRDPTILREFLDSSELMDMFDPLSPDKWKDESFVELRRCLVIIGFLCSVDHMTARYIINPKAYNSSRSRDFYPQSQDLSQATKDSGDDVVAVKITVKQGERKPGELKLMQMYRDLHLKKLTLAADLANSFSSDKNLPLPPTITFDLTVPMEVDPEYENTLLARKALKSALESNAKNSVLRSGTFSSSRICPLNADIDFNEFKNALSAFGLTLDDGELKDMVAKIQGDLTPQKVLMLKKIADKPDSHGSQISATYRVSVPEQLFEAVRSDILGVSGDYGIIGAPVNRCISHLEKQMMQLALANNQSLKRIIEDNVEHNPPVDLDLTRYASSSTDAEFEMTRKRKISVGEIEPRKSMKVADYESPPFDKTLYSQIQKEPPNDAAATINDTQELPSTQVEDDQMAKFERREEMAELKRKMLAEEKKLEFKSRHTLAPIRIPGRNSPTNEDSADKEVAMEIEKMFQTQVRPDLQMNESVQSSESDDEGSETRIFNTNEDNVEIESIPELVKHFHNKLTNAGLLELLCEVFKEGGVLRYSHRLNGVILGTVVMLQKIVMYQKREVEPCLSKLATILREILYTRPSPRIVLELNILLRYSVPLPGFIKMLCHNASPETFVTSNELVYFTRGACMLEVVCILVTYATEEDTDYSVYLEMIHWVYHIICTEKKHMASLYEQHNTDRRRCMCITALNNTLVMVFHRTLSLYRGLAETNKKSHLRRHLDKITISCLQVLRVMYSYGSLQFLSTIRTQLVEFRQLLSWLQEMHRSDIYKWFKLSPANLYIVSELLKDNRDPNLRPKRPQEPKEQPDMSRYFARGNPWPYDLENTESLIKADSSESEEE